MTRPFNPSLPIVGGRYRHIHSTRVGTVTRVLCAGSRERRYRYVHCEIRDDLRPMFWKSNLDAFWRSWWAHVVASET